MKLIDIYNCIIEDVSPSRLKSSNKHIFNPPIEGLNGTSLISYEWAWKGAEKFNKHDGGLVATRVSDWDKALASAETGRDLVHQFTVKTPNGEKIVSAESVVNALGFVDKGTTIGIPSLVNSVKTLAKLTMQFNTANNLKQAYTDAKKEIESKLPEFTVDNIKHRDDGSIANFEVRYNGKSFITSNFDRNVKSETDFDISTNSSDSINDRIRKGIVDKELGEMFGKIPYGAMNTSDLSVKIKKQEQKIQQLSKQHNTEI